MATPAQQEDHQTISVVVSAFDASDSIAACLESLLNASYRGDSEVIVVDSSTDRTAQIVADRFPQVRLHRSSKRLFPGESRNLGLAESRGELMAFLDANCIPADDWLSEVSRAHRGPQPAIGGVIENGDRRLAGWVSYFCKLAKWMPRPAPEPIGDLPSETLSIKRWALASYGPFAEGTYSTATAFSWRLGDEGHAPWLDPAISVSRVGGPSLRSFLQKEPRHGRDYARIRVRDQRFSAVRRLGYALASPALPFLLFGRAARNVMRYRRYRRQFVMTAPLVFLGFVSWSFGEFLGYVAGPTPEQRVEPAR